MIVSFKLLSLFLFPGTGSLGMIWMYTLKSVRFLILNKGGRHLTFVTYTPFGKNRMMTVPIQDVCCKENRASARVQLPLKVKNTMMHYMLDMRGEFKNPLLFDSTAGLARKWWLSYLSWTKNDCLKNHCHTSYKIMNYLCHFVRSRAIRCLGMCCI